MRACAAPGSASAGEAEYGVRVDPDGKATLVKALKSTLGPAMLNCTLARIRAWAFPTSEDGAAFRFTMAFGQPEQRLAVADTTDIKTTITHRTRALRHCYDEALRKDPTQFGRLDYEIVIAVDGSVSSATAEAEPQANLSSALVDCTLEKIEAWRIPMVDAEIEREVSFSVVFSEEVTPKAHRPEGNAGGPPPP